MTVTLDPDGRKTDFGFSGTSGNGKTISGYTLSFSDSVSVEWTEDEMVRRSTIDLSPYARKRSQIRSMSFYYLGEDRWEVLARDGYPPS